MSSTVRRISGFATSCFGRIPTRGVRPSGPIARHGSSAMGSSLSQVEASISSLPAMRRRGHPDRPLRVRQLLPIPSRVALRLAKRSSVEPAASRWRTNSSTVSAVHDLALRSPAVPACPASQRGVQAPAHGRVHAPQDSVPFPMILAASAGVNHPGSNQTTAERVSFTM